MSKVKLDLSKFSHVKSDEDNATLRHKDGHTLTIAIKALGPESQEQLKAMCHGGRAKMAKGGVSHQSHEEAGANSAYDAGLPCKNPHCKSQGQPHPNCRCYGNMAHGGKAESFCDKPRTHFAGCEYLAEGTTDASYDNVKANVYTAANAPIYNKTDPKYYHATTPEQDKQADARNAASNANYRKEYPTKSEPEPSDEGYKTYSTGGKVNSDAGNPKLEESKKVPPKEGNTLDYNKLRREFIEIKGRRYYADPSEPVSNSDSAPGILDSATNWYHEPAKAGTFGTGPQASEQGESLKKSGQQWRGDRALNAKGGKVQYYEDGGKAQHQDTEIPDITQSDAQEAQMQPKEDNRDLHQLYDKPDQQQDVQGAQADSPPGTMIPPEPPPSPEQQAQDVGQEGDANEAQGAQLAQQAQPQAPANPLANERAPNPGEPLSARQQAIYQVKHAEATDEQKQENLKFAQDIQNGHITPKDYNDLFAKNADGTDRSTLGKIGMLFGMLVSGVGSGLAHQPNAVMAMMDKQIQNDLEAQAKSKTNAHNFVQLNVQNELNKAQEQLAISGKHLNQAQTAQVYNNAQKIGFENSSIQAYTSAMADLENQLKKIPEGNTPDLIKRRQDISSAMAQLYQKVGEKFQNSNAIIAGAKANNGIMFDSTGETSDSTPTNWDPDKAESAYQDHQNQLLKLGQTNEAARRQWDINNQQHIPGVFGHASGPIDPGLKNKVLAHNTLDKQMTNLQDAVKKYSAMSARGNFDPKVLGPMAVKAHETAALYNQTLDGLGMTEGRMGWLDKQIPNNPQSFMEQLKGSKEKLDEVAKNNRMRKNMILNGQGGMGFPKQPGQDQDQQSQQEKPRVRVIPNVTHELKKYSNGNHWVPIKK